MGGADFSHPFLGAFAEPLFLLFLDHVFNFRLMDSREAIHP